MKRKEDTPQRIMRRRYEETHADERKAKTKVWGTSIDRQDAEKINRFLKENHLTKVELIYAGFIALTEKYK